MIDFSIFGIDPLLALILLPAVGTVVVGAFFRQTWLARIGALAFSLLTLGLAVAVFFIYQNNAESVGYGYLTFSEPQPWFALLGSQISFGIDGISAAMILLTGILSPLAILVSWEVSDRAPAHLALLLLFEAGSMGVFATTDLMIFFLFYELSLVPMYFLINQWGSPGGRLYASTKFMIYSIGGTLGMLLAIQLIGWASSLASPEMAAQVQGVLPGFEAGMNTYNMQALSVIWPQLSNTLGTSFLGIPIETVKALAFIGFFVAFAIKVPIWPFHTWLPDAHGEAPTAGSMLLAGVMLKLGAYGFIRLVVPLFPDVWISEAIFGMNFATIFAILSVLGIVLGALAAFGQNDIKRLVAYSSVNHMGFVGIGVAVMALLYGESWQAAQQSTAGLSADMLQTGIIATNGAVMQMFNHGLSAAGMFLLAGGLYHKTHTRDMSEYGGLWVRAPIFGGIFIFTSMASLGLPGLNGFIGEFLVVRGTWPVFTVLTALSMIGLLFTGSYILKGIRAVLHGPFNMKWLNTNLELHLNEMVAISPLLVLMLITGILPNWILLTINGSVTAIMNGIG
ncbi:NADH-quinone oxidoreductase subunit M [Phototrophicus methaneseepsis]|uniref:NADH-quinone oxidoreductase subunit M n=1 Tax=Phototrophicus methaneseepsis TaxID=2710758 RepID=A0A7S8E7S0_9CHLR|nr:NADH-quinone oxidoreductase subunit M [Phototrophicus methaneseepsis]QPC81904.1 NADH-quinone oxidoreductase subunit M [Phototrophicus methaneseepsis]